MPLIPEILEADLKKAFSDLEPTIKSELDKHFSAKTIRHTSAGVDENLQLGGAIESEMDNSVYTVQEKTDKWAVENPPGPLDTAELRAIYKDKLWSENAKNWAKSLSEHISKDITSTLSKELAPAMTKIITDYLYSASLVVTIPPGSITVGVGAASVLNPVPIQIILEPKFDWPRELDAAKLKIYCIGGLK